MRLLLLIAMLLANGCKDHDNLPTTSMRIGQETFTLEIAADPQTRETGLMHRESMPANRGMIFVFAGDAPRSFWMKNTLIPLDILFVSLDGEVVDIGHMKPIDGRASTKRLVRYAIELNLGAAERTGVRKGDVLDLPEEIKALRPAQ